MFLSFVGCSDDGKIALVEETYPGLSLGMLKNAKLTKMKPETLAEAGGAQITSAQLQSMLGAAGFARVSGFIFVSLAFFNMPRLRASISVSSTMAIFVVIGTTHKNKNTDQKKSCQRQ